MEKFKNKYRLSSTRLHGYDYSRAGAYYITIVTKNREQYFGEIKNKQFYPNDLGLFVETEWVKTPLLRPEMNVELDVFTVMPNHFHAIILIGLNNYNYIPAVENHFAPQSMNLASILRGFKSAVTSNTIKNSIVFSWHSRFHDHIIRDYEELQRIRDYIRNNPANWDEDDFFKD